MMHLYVMELCNALGFKNKKDNNYVRLKVMDDRNRVSGEFIISRKCIPEGTELGDELVLQNKTRSIQCQHQIQSS